MPEQKPEPKATAADVRILGTFFVVSGALAGYFSRGYYLDGIVPVEWVAGFIIAMGTACIAFPQPFRQRASRFNELGEAISRRRK